MSILHRTAYLTLSALLAIVPAACGGDDDDDDTADDTADDTSDDSTDDGDGPDASTPDAGTPDAGDVEPDAAGLEGDQYLLGLDITANALGMELTGVGRIIATVALDGTTATFQLQPIVAPECEDAPVESGEPIGDARLVEDVAIVDGAFEFNIPDAEFPAGSVGIALACGLDLGANVTITGSVASGVPCGTLDGELTGVKGTVEATFGGVAIEFGTTGDDNLPDAVLDCPAVLN